jgi:GNAT superfamily N-acetyltransferase
MPLELLSDLSLSRRLERAEALASARFVEARARLAPDVGAAWMEEAGAFALFDGVDSPLTQTFGLGVFETPGAAAMDRIERFFRERGACVHHEVSPVAGKQMLALLTGRGYRPVELTNVMYLPLAGRVGGAGEGGPSVRIPGEQARDLWARTGAEGWSDLTEFAPLLYDLMRVSAASEGVLPFLAELDGRAIAAASLNLQNGVALLSGASTVSAWRKRGAQRALLEARLDYAARAGCDLAMIGAEPGSASARNAERRGFRVAYTRIKWELAGSAEPLV